MSTIIKNVPMQGYSPQDKTPDAVKALRVQHPLYVEYAPAWAFFLSAYEGGAEFCKPENIFRHTRETQADYDDRVKRVHSMNYCEILVDFFTNFIFSEAIDRDAGTNKDMFLSFVEDVNRKSTDINTFMREVSDDMQIFGMSYVLVDAPVKPQGQVVTKQDEKDLGIRPYWVNVKPVEILNWVTDDFGVYKYVKRCQIVTRFTGGAVTTFEKYTEFTEDKTRVSMVSLADAKEPVLVSAEDYGNSLGKIPLVVARFKRSKRDPQMGLSFLRDFAYNNREIVNLTSLLQEFLYRQAFNVLAKETDNNVPTMEQTEGDVGTSNVLEYPKGAKAPSYISPASDPAKFIQDERSRIKSEMFVRAAQDAMTELFNGEKSSGFSQSQSFSKTVPFIASRADTLELVENKLMELTMEMVNKTWDGSIRYKDRYEITNLTDALTQLQILVKDFQIPSETFVKEELKRMVREYDGKLPQELIGKVESEIDGMDFDKWAKNQKEALLGRQPTSPAAQQKPKGTGTMLEVAQEAGVKTAGAKKIKAGQE